MLTGEDVRVRGQKRRMREEMTLTQTLTLTLTLTQASPLHQAALRSCIPSCYCAYRRAVGRHYA